ncbi:hypothetical protein VCHA37O177_190037 [Vibrio chagasii]|nr:hypothetical protein VCHA28FP16_180038 [Vibrio chagasii]CAH7232731.1 hypothetical protein VCHA37O177_190037 [Vibrio chagasii]
MDWNSFLMGVLSNAAWAIGGILIGWVLGSYKRNKKFYEDLDTSLDGLSNYITNQGLNRSEYQCIDCGSNLESLYSTHVSNYASFKKIVVDEEIETLTSLSDQLKKLENSEDNKEVQKALVDEFYTKFFALKKNWPHKVKSMKRIHYTIKDS